MHLLYLEGRVRETERQTEEETYLPSTCLFSKCKDGQYWASLKPGARSQEPCPDLPCECRGSRSWIVLLCFPRPESWIRSGTAGTQPHTLWDASVTGGESVRYATMRASNFLLLNELLKALTQVSCTSQEEFSPLTLYTHTTNKK